MPFVNVFVSRPDLQRFLAGEIVVMALVNGALSALAGWLTFSGAATVSVWGRGGLAFDLLPGTVVPVALMCLTATPFVHWRCGKGAVPACGWSDLKGLVSRSPRHLAVRTALLCLSALGLFAPAATTALWLAGWTALPLEAVLAGKAVYGLAVGAVVCPFVVLPAATQWASPR